MSFWWPLKEPLINISRARSNYINALLFQVPTRKKVGVYKSFWRKHFGNMFSQTLFVLAALSVSVYAQGSSSTSAPAGTPSISPCILGCIIPAANQNGCSGMYVLRTLLKFRLVLNPFKYWPGVSLYQRAIPSWCPRLFTRKLPERSWCCCWPSAGSMCCWYVNLFQPFFELISISFHSEPHSHRNCHSHPKSSFILTTWRQLQCQPRVWFV